MTFLLPMTLVLTAWSGKNSQDGHLLEGGRVEDEVGAATAVRDAVVVADVTDEELHPRVAEPLAHLVLLGLVAAQDADRATSRSSRWRTIVDPNDPVPPVMVTVEPLISCTAQSLLEAVAIRISEPRAPTAGCGPSR